MPHRAPLLALVLAASPALAHADLVGARETACATTVELAGPIATVTETHELRGADPAPALVRRSARGWHTHHGSGAGH